MADRPRIAIVGAGNLGSALAVALHRAGYPVDAIIGRAGRSSSGRPSFKSQANIRKLAKAVHARVLADSLEGLRADVIWFSVPDGEIHRASKDFAERARWTRAEWRKKIALHSSGALGSDELAVLRRQGAAVASVHPMMTFVGGAAPSLRGVPFALEGDARAVRAARGIVLNLGGDAYAIRKADKAAYHAWGTFASPLLTALLATTEQVAALAGVKRTSSRRRMMPILKQTVENYATRDPQDAFSGPIIRGDIETVERHLRALSESPVARDVYRALARAAVELLPGKNKGEMKNALRTRSPLLSSKARAK